MKVFGPERVPSTLRHLIERRRLSAVLWQYSHLIFFCTSVPAWHSNDVSRPIRLIRSFECYYSQRTACDRSIVHQIDWCMLLFARHTAPEDRMSQRYWRHSGGTRRQHDHSSLRCSETAGDRQFRSRLLSRSWRTQLGQPRLSDRLHDADVWGARWNRK